MLEGSERKIAKRVIEALTSGLAAVDLYEKGGMHSTRNAMKIFLSIYDHKNEKYFLHSNKRLSSMSQDLINKLEEVPLKVEIYVNSGKVDERNKKILTEELTELRNSMYKIRGG